MAYDCQQSTGYNNDNSNISEAFKASSSLKAIPTYEIALSGFLRIGGRLK
jgi:hypothetical protein